MKNLLKRWNDTSLVLRILCGLILGVILGLAAPQATPVALLGDLFVGALKAVAPILVLFLVMTALSRHQEGQKTNMSRVIVLYLLGTFIDGCVAVVTSFLFPVTLELTAAQEQTAAPGGIGEVLHTLLMNLVANPVDALVNANYIGILAWAVLLGVALRKADPGTKRALENIADAVSQVVRWVISCAPFGVMGLVFNSISQLGVESLLSYGKLILLLVGTMVFVALVVNPLIAFVFLRKNPYPLVLKCLWRSGLTAFFTRSSAANIPVNLKLCEELGLDEDTYAVSIPLGSTPWASRWTSSPPLSCASCPPSAPAGPPAWRAGPCCWCPWPALCSASPTTWPCRWWAWASSWGSSRTPARPPSTPPPTCSTPPWPSCPRDGRRSDRPGLQPSESRKPSGQPDGFLRMKGPSHGRGARALADASFFCYDNGKKRGRFW